MKKGLIIGLIAVLCPCFVHANYIEKANIEENLQRKVQHILDTMYGPNLFSVNAEVDLGRESWIVNYTDRAAIEFNEKKKLPGEKYNILPGYSAIKNLSPNEAVQMPFNSKITKRAAPIIKITFEIVTSKLLSKRDVKAADKLITELLELNDERGDSIEFIFKNFPIHKDLDEEVKIGLPLEAKLMIVVLIITSVFLIIYILLQIKQLNVSRESVKAQKDAAKSMMASKSAGPPVAEKKAAESDDVSSKLGVGTGKAEVSGYFSFVNEKNNAQFVTILKKSELSTAQYAMVVSYIPPVLAKRILDTLDSEKQLEVIKELADEKILDKDDLDTLDEELKNQLECSVGGASKVVPVISKFNDSEKKTFLSSIQENAELYGKIRPEIIMFDDIIKLDDGDVKKLIGAVNIEVLASSVVTDTTGTGEKIKSNLSGAAKAMVNQFVELKKTQLSADDISDAQHQVVHVLQELSDSGRVDIRSKLIS